MRIAIASCSNPNNYPNQPVWTNIAKKSPDALVLLGDTIYLDIPWVSISPTEMVHPSDADAMAFLEHGHRLYQAQLARPPFAALVANVAQTYAIWDDHDFLWNGAAGDALPQIVFRDHIRATRALLRIFRETLASRNPASFPGKPTDARLHVPYESPPGNTTVELDDTACLHLTDGRSFRNKHHLLGSAQRSQIAAEMQKWPDRIHLVASGSVFNGDRGDRWSAFPEDFEWLKAMAVNHRIVVLSGDVHENRIPPPFKVAGGHDILEITSSGAAVGTLVAMGKQKHNFGLVEIASGSIVLSTFKDRSGVPDLPPFSKRISKW